MSDEIYESEFYCSKCKTRWFEFTLAYAVCDRCNNVVWAIECPEGCLSVHNRDEV